MTRIGNTWQRVWTSLAALMLVIGVLGACAPTVPTQPPPSQAQAPVEPEPEAENPEPSARTDGVARVALLLPLSGTNADLGRAMLDAAQLALFDVADGQFVLMPKNTRGTPEGAAAAAREATEEGADLILGPVFGALVPSVRPAATAADVPVISFTTDRTQAGDGVWVMGFLPDEQVDRVVRFARAQGMTRFAALAPASPYGRTTLDALYSVAEETGSRVVEARTYDPGLSDVATAVRGVSQQDQRTGSPPPPPGYDALLISDGGDRLLAIAPSLTFYDLDPGVVQLLGTGLWNDPAVRNEDALIGGWFAAPDPEAGAEFERRYEDLYDRSPPLIATLAYDAVALAAVLARRNPDGDPYAIETLTDPLGFTGTNGIFRFRPDGLPERGLAVLQVERDEFIVIDSAPISFEPRVF